MNKVRFICALFRADLPLLSGEDQIHRASFTVRGRDEDVAWDAVWESLWARE